jgi:ABC-type transport system involved in multi-copper enzyme maturation permease subunit
MLHYLAIFFGPIFAKEMVEIARRRRYYAMRVLYGAVLFLTLFTVYENHWYDRSTGRMSIHAMARMAQSTYEAISGVQLAAVFLFVPIFLCGVIANEREEQTLDLLFTTSLVNREIVLGKLFSRLAVLIFLILCAMPFMSIIMFFGGIDPDALWRMQSATLLAMIYSGATAIYYSTVTRSPMGAMVRTYWRMAFWLIGLPALIWMISFAIILALNGGRMTAAPPTWILYAISIVPFVNPLGTYIVGAVPELHAYYEAKLGSWFYPLLFIMTAIWSFFLVWRATRLLRVPPKPVTSFIERMRWVGALRRAWAVPQTARRFMPEYAWLVLPVRNPLWLRARRAPVYDREGHIRRLQTACWLLTGVFLLLVIAIEIRSVTHHECAMVFASATWIAVTVFTAIIAGTGVVGDRRRGLLELILMTPMTPREIVSGSMLTVWQHMQRLCWLPVFLCLFFVLTGAVRFTDAVFSLMIAGLFLWLLIVHGTACSLSARTLAPALTMTMLLPVLTIAIVPFIGAMFRDYCGPALGLLVVIFFIVMRITVRRKSGAAAVGSYLLAVHLAMIMIATCWTWGEGRNGEPILAINPAVMTILSLSDKPIHYRADSRWEWMQVCYIAALAINVLYVRRWGIRNFDRLTDRCGDSPQRPGRPLHNPEPKAVGDAAPALVGAMSTPNQIV